MRSLHLARTGGSARPGLRQAVKQNGSPAAAPDAGRPSPGGRRPRSRPPLAPKQPAGPVQHHPGALGGGEGGGKAAGPPQRGRARPRLPAPREKEEEEEEEQERVPAALAAPPRLAGKSGARRRRAGQAAPAAPAASASAGSDPAPPPPPRLPSPLQGSRGGGAPRAEGDPPIAGRTAGPAGRGLALCGRGGRAGRAQPGQPHLPGCAFQTPTVRARRLEGARAVVATVGP